MGKLRTELERSVSKGDDELLTESHVVVIAMIKQFSRPLPIF